MRFIADQDYHIHSGLSLCSDDPKQTPQAILDFSKKNGFKKICLTDHYWDESVPKAGSIDFYDIQNTVYIKKALPLPQDDEVEYHFGAEVDMDKNYTIGIGDKMINELDFIVVPTTHLHFVGFTIDEKDTSLERRADIFVKRFEKLLDADLPFHKVGKTFRELFTRTAKCGMGVEINFEPNAYSGDDIARVKRPYLIAKECGCKFYMATDAHHNKELASAKEDFDRRTDFLDLKEEQKFKPFG